MICLDRPFIPNVPTINTVRLREADLLTPHSWARYVDYGTQDLETDVLIRIHTRDNFNSLCLRTSVRAES